MLGERRRGEEILDFRSEAGNLQIVEEEQNTPGRYIRARPLRNNGTRRGVSS